MWDKIDKKLFEFSEKIILYFVGRSKHKKHKYKILRYFSYMEFVFIALVWIFSIVQIVGEGGDSVKAIIFSSAIFGLVSAAHIRSIFVLNERITSYDPLFDSRKNMYVYSMVKQHCKVMLKTDILRRKKVLLFVFLLFGFVGGMDLLSFLIRGAVSDLFWCLFFFWVIYMDILESYIPCIFDFDKPKNKQKKESKELTGLQKKSWVDLLKRPTLKPFPI